MSLFPRRSLRRICALLLLSQPASLALANPRGGVVIGGAASIDQSQAALTTIRQSSSRAIINWNSFSNTTGETIRFVQPSARSATLNRVTGAESSVINGALQANGRVFVLNPNGVLFGSTAKVSVGGLVASTLDMKDHDFMAGRDQLEQRPDKPLGAVVNQGTITTSRGGAVALVAPVVSNEGRIEAPGGRVALAAGTKALVNLDGDGLVNVAVRTGTPGDVVADEQAVGALVRQAVNTNHVIKAGGIVTENGRVVLKRAEGLAVNSGTISTDDPAQAGSVELRSTQATVLGRDSRITANGTAARGRGGEVIVHSRGTTVFDRGSRIEARGGEGGAGGFVDVSGQEHVHVLGEVDTQAPGGAGGTFLIDPAVLRIVNGSAGTGSLDSALGDGTIAAGDGGASDTLTVGQIIASSATNNLVVLQASNEIVFENTSAITLGVGSSGTGASLAVQTLGGTGIRTATGSPGAITAQGSGQIFFVADGGGSVDLTGLAVNANTTSGFVLVRASGTVTLGSITANTVEVSAGGTVLDSNGASLNVNAATLRMAGSQVGNSGDPIDTQVSFLDANGSTGGVFVNQTGAIQLGTVTSRGLTSVTASGNITLGFPGGGLVSGDDVSLNSLPGSIIDGNDSGGIAYTNIAAVDNANLVGNSVGTAGSAVEISVGNLSGGFITEFNVPNSANTTLGAIASLGTVFVHAHGHLIDGNGASLNVTADELFVVTKAFAGVNPGVTAVDFIETSINRLNATAGTTVGGGLYITDTDANGLMVTSATAPSTFQVFIIATGDLRPDFVSGDAVILRSTAGNIVDGPGSTNVVAGTLTLQAGANVGSAVAPLDTQASILSGSRSGTSGSGSFFLSDTDGISIADLIATGTGQQVGIRTESNGDIVLTNQISATNVTLLATGGTAGSIVDANGETVTEIIAPGVVNLQADTSVGEGNPLEVTSIRITGSAGTGTFDVRPGGNSEVGAITAGTSVVLRPRANGDLRITGTISAPTVTLDLLSITSGSIVDQNTTGDDIVGSSIGLYAPNSVGSTANPLEISATFLQALATSGTISVRDADGVEVFGAVAGNIVDIRTRGSGDIVIRDAISASSVTLDATGGTSGSVRTLFSGTDITASGATLRADTAVGDSAAPLFTNVNSLTATAGTGGVFISEADGIFLTGITAGNGVNVATRGSGDINVFATITGLFVVLQATGGTSGSIVDLNGVGDDIVSTTTTTLRADNDVGGADALETSTVQLTGFATAGTFAVSEANGVDLLSITAGTAIDVRTRGSGDIRVATTQSAPSVTLDATGGSSGSILDLSTATNDLVATTLVLRADGSVGTLTDPFETDVTTLSGSAGSDFVAFDANAITLAGVTAGGVVGVATRGNGDIRITGTLSGSGVELYATGGTTGSILDANTSGDDLVATDLVVLQADTDVGAGDPLETNGARLSGFATSGRFDVREADGAALAGIQAGTAIDVRTRGSGDLTITSTITAPTINLDATGGTAGSILRGGAALNLVGGSATLSADGSVGLSATPLFTNLDAIGGTASGGDFAIIDQSGITVAGISSTALSAVLTAGNGDIVLTGAISGNTIQVAATGGTAGSVVDANAAGDDLIATDSILLEADTSVGAGDPLETRGARIGGFATAGTFQVREADGVTLQNTTAGTSIDVRTRGSGDITLAGVLSAGTVNLEATGGTSGSILDTFVGDDIVATSATLLADTAVGSTTNGLDTQVVTLAGSASGGDFVVLERDGVTLAGVSATGAVVIATRDNGDIRIAAPITGLTVALAASGGTSGSIVDANTNGDDVVATDLVTLSADTSIGAADPLETSAARITAAAQTGTLDLREADGAALEGLFAGGALVVRTRSSGDLVITSTISGATVELDATAGTSGSILDGFTGTDISAVGTTLRADTHVGLSTNSLDLAVDTLTGSAAGGDFSVIDSGGLSLGTTSASGQVTVQIQGDGDIRIAGPVTAARVVLAAVGGAAGSIVDAHSGGDDLIASEFITLAADTSVGAGDPIEINTAALGGSAASGTFNVREADGILLASTTAGGAVDIRTRGSGDITLGGVVSGATVTLDATAGTSGSILDAFAGTELVAGTVTLNADGDVGSATNSIDTAAGTLGGTSGRDFYVSDDDGIALSGITAGRDLFVFTRSDGDIRIEGQLRGSIVQLSANDGATGSIIDANGTGDDIVATSSVLLFASTDAGTAANAIETTTPRLGGTVGRDFSVAEADGATLESITAGGSVNFLTRGAGDVTLAGTVTGSAIQMLVNGGSILDGNGGFLDFSTTGLLDLSAAGTIGTPADFIEATFGTVNAVASGVYLNGSGDLVLGAIDTGGSLSIVTNGNITLTGGISAAQLSLNAGFFGTRGSIFDRSSAANDIRVTGELNLFAFDGIGADDPLEISAPVVVAGTKTGDLRLAPTGSIALRAVVVPGLVEIASRDRGLVELEGVVADRVIVSTGTILGPSTGLGVFSRELVLRADRDAGTDARPIRMPTGGALTATGSGVKVVSDDTVTLGDVTATESDVSVTADGRGDIVVAGTIRAPGTVTLRAAPFVLQRLIDAHPGTDIFAERAVLDANATVGTREDPIEIDVTTLAGRSAAGDFFVTESSDLAIDGLDVAGELGLLVTSGSAEILKRVQARRITLSTPQGAIDDDNVAQGTDLDAPDGITLTARESIGLDLDPLELNTSRLDARSETENVRVTNVRDLALRVEAPTGEVSVASLSGGITVEGARAGTQLTLFAGGGAIRGAAPAFDVEAPVVSLTAGTAVGTPDDPLRVAASSILADARNGGVDLDVAGEATLVLVSALGPSGDVRIANHGGDLTLRAVRAAGALVLSTDGSLLDGNGDTRNLGAASFDLTAAGDIGRAADALELVGGSLVAHAGGEVAVFGRTSLSVALVTAGGAVRAGSAGNLSLGRILSGGEVELVAGEDLLDANGNAGNLAGAGGAVRLRAGGVIGTRADPLEVDVRSRVAVSASGSDRGASVVIDGVVGGAGVLDVIGDPPGLVIFNGRTGASGLVTGTAMERLDAAKTLAVVAAASPPYSGIASETLDLLRVRRQADQVEIGPIWPYDDEEERGLPGAGSD